MHWIGWVTALLLAAILIQIIYYQNRKDRKLICDYLYNIDKKLETLIIKIESGNKVMWNGLDKISASVGTAENQVDKFASFIGDQIEIITKKLDYYLEKQESILGSNKSFNRENSDLMDKPEIPDDEESTDTVW
jgi:hypothetical protein